MSKNPSAVTVDPPKIRRFPIEPVETTFRSSHEDKIKKKLGAGYTEEKVFETTTTAKRFLPEPVETSFRSHRQKKVSSTSNSPKDLPPTVATPDDYASPQKPKVVRKFVPELIETSRRSKRRGDPGPATLPTDKTDLTPGIPNIYTTSKVRRQESPSFVKNNSNSNIYTNHLSPFKPRRQSSMRPHYNTRHPTRQGSYSSALEPIASSESDSDSNSPQSPPRTPSLSRSIESSEDSLQRNQFTGMRESCDDRFSGYLLALAAKAAEKQLREQALLAAFPNESSHEIVEHFYDREIEGASDNDSQRDENSTDTHHKTSAVSGLEISERVVIRRRSSDSGWALQEMQVHHDKFSRSQENQKARENTDELVKDPYHDPFWTYGQKYQASFDKGAVAEKELQKMRNAANPPMLGGSLKFRICPSPKSTKFESDQKVNIKLNRSDNGGGLWGGYCVADKSGEAVSTNIIGPPLIHTPKISESFGDPFESEFDKEILQTEDKILRSPRAGRGVRMISGVGERLKCEAAKSKKAEKQLEEFDDRFVTQVYNYLSLGYPSIAVEFDEELSRITKIPVEELRLDDQSSVKGHIELRNLGAHRDESNDGIGNTKSSGERGNRWRALKIYILEWGKQNPSLSQATVGPSAWGTTTRRGSWAI